MAFLSLTRAYSYHLFFKIYYSGAPSLFPCQYCSYRSSKYIIIPFKFIKYTHCMELNKKCINVSWELLDKVHKDIISQIKSAFNKLEYI